MWDLLRPHLLGQRNRWRRASRGERVAMVVFTVFGLTFWIGIFALFGWLVDSFHQVEVFGPILSRKLLELTLFGLFVLLCFSNVVTALSTYYLSEDLELLLSLPVSRLDFHLSRLAETIAESSWMLAFFGIPIFAAYGWAYQAGWPYAGALLAVLPGFVLIPAALGVGLASVLVTVFPARRIREALVLVGMLTLVFVVVFLRLLRPERLVDAAAFDSLAAYVADLQAPIPLLAPPRWASDVLVASLMGRPFPWVELGLLLTGAVAATGIARWVTDWLYDQGRSRAQEARAARLARAGWLDRVLAVWTAPLPRNARAVVVKDVKVFFRDPAQWSQVFLVASIVVISLASVAAMPLDMFRGPWAATWRNSFAFLGQALVGFIMAAVAARFQFTAVSAEGRAFWIIRSSPMGAERYLWSKVWPTLLPMVLVGQVLAVASATILGARPWMIAIASGTAMAEAFSLAGIAVAMGAVWPDFKAANVARVASGPTGVLYMVVAVSVVFLFVVLELLPVWLLLNSEIRDTSLSALEWLGVVGPLVLVVVLAVSTGLSSIRYGARSLWSRELPGS